MLIASEVHRGHFRNYTGAPYLEHLAEVATYVQCFGCDPETVAAAWLHDSIEDKKLSKRKIKMLFGERVKDIVLEVSDLETGNRATRKAASVARLAGASVEAQLIKIADIMSNTKSIAELNPDFARSTYLQEKENTLNVLTKVPIEIWMIARQQLDECWAKINRLSSEETSPISNTAG